MREAIGGTWLFGIVILFIALFSAFLAYSVSYTKAFNTKNEIINIIERKRKLLNLKLKVVLMVKIELMLPDIPHKLI